MICLALCLNAAACSKQKEAPPALDAFQQLGIEKPEKRISAPDFVLEDLSGQRVQLKGFKGKVVFLNFWAVWCLPCREEMSSMETLHRNFKRKGLEVVAVNMRDPNGEVRKFFHEFGLTFTGLLDEDGDIAEAYGVWSIPLSYIINREGEFVGKVIGYRKWDVPEAISLFASLLDQSP
jgi:peroxiredoxin